MPPLLLPQNFRDQVLHEIYRRADELDWEFLTNNEKTEQYRRWVDDPAVGGLMLRYNAEKDVRVWLKDIAMKEYARAQEGIGSFMRYLPRRFKGVQEVVDAGLGISWTAKPDSILIKPNRCTATRGPSSRLVFWGRKGGFKDLFWSALTLTKGGGDEAVIVITTRDGENISEENKKRQKAIGRRGDFEVVFLNRQMITNPDYVPL